MQCATTLEIALVSRGKSITCNGLVGHREKTSNYGYVLKQDFSVIFEIG